MKEDENDRCHSCIAANNNRRYGTETGENKRQYRKFRKFLIQKGFLMMQESVYCKLALNTTVADAIVQAVKANKPNEGLVQLLVITEKQYARMEFVIGSSKSDILDTDERIVVL